MYRQYVYDPYGNVISVKDGGGHDINIGNDTGFNNAYTYRGYRYDSETGLYFLNARYYVAGIGRLLTKDSVLGHLSSSQTLNRYAYCGGDPVNHIDPDGRDWVDWVFGGLIAAAVVIEFVPFAVGEAIMTAFTTVAAAVTRIFTSPVATTLEDGAGESAASGATQAPITATEDVIRNAMKDAPLKTQQRSVSQPVIQRYVNKLQSGEEAPPIHVDGGIIVDGNHRYIAGRIVGQEPLQTPWPGGSLQRVIIWHDLAIDHFDWGNK